MAIVIRSVAPRHRRWLVSVATFGWLAWALPDTLVVFLIVTLAAWCAGYAISAGRDSNIPAYLSSTALLLGFVGLRLYGPVFGGLTISVDETSNQLFALIGIAYLLLKAHHYFRAVAYDRLLRASLYDLFLYFSYLPCITAGPILRMREWNDLWNPPESSTEAASDFDAGCRRILWGLGKKVLVIPLLLAGLRTWNADAPEGYDFLLSVPVSLAVIYLDFSGYSDIAVGLGRLLGHRLRENFDAPFKATSLSHFWRRWHITMGDWLRDHIFIPLGGMRANRAKASLISFVVMLVCGLWHAFDLRFLVWGIYHGLLLSLEGALGVKPLPPGAAAWRRIGRRAVVVVIMCGSTVFFMPGFWE